MSARKNNKLDSAGLFQAGSIIPRIETFYQQVQLFALPFADHEILLKRIEALIPHGVALERYLSGDSQVIYCTSSWKAKLVRTQDQHAPSGEVWQAYEFWFTNPKKKTDYQAILQMNVLATAVEKAFLLTDPQTIVRVKYGTTTARDFDLGPQAAEDSPLFEIAELAEFSPFSLALKAVKIGSEAAGDVLDSVRTKAINKALAEANAADSLLISRYLGMPALPDKLKVLADPDPVSDAGFAVSADTIVPDNQVAGYCASCGAEVAAGDVFCGTCGAPLAST